EHKAETEKLLEQYERGVYTYPDLSDYQLLFLGDSIMGNYKGSYSIPGMIAGLTGAQAFNCGEGGVCAAKTEDSGWSAYRMAMGIRDEGTRPVSDKGQYTEGVELFVTDYDSEKNTHIFIEFGINDFLKQMPLGSSANPETETEYYGALRMTVERLRKDYPQADICILTPTYVIPEEESEHTLEEYVLAATAVAEDLGITYIDMNTLMGIEKEAYVAYLEDECHLNEAGRLAYANVLIDYLNIWDMVHEQE
ncbi:MAG: SGNH/GDSL hydrolase family protein, partial [Lachnospiraceae bacterium]|nr:SGNH/GDSL hydrolase family protein [Lachnospiraceae bacterium]